MGQYFSYRYMKATITIHKRLSNFYVRIRPLVLVLSDQ